MYIETDSNDLFFWSFFGGPVSALDIPDDELSHASLTAKRLNSPKRLARRGGVTKVKNIIS